MIEALILMAIGVAEILYWGMVILLLIQSIYEWFNGIVDRTPNDIGFTVKEALSSGNVRVVQGVFNKRTNELTTKPRSIDANRLDEKLESYHSRHKVVVYE